MLIFLGVWCSIRGAFISPSASRNRSDAQGSPGVQPPPPAAEIHFFSTNLPKLALFWPVGMPETVIKGFSQRRPPSRASFSADFPRASLGRAKIHPGMRSWVKNLKEAAFMSVFFVKILLFHAVQAMVYRPWVIRVLRAQTSSQKRHRGRSVWGRAEIGRRGEPLGSRSAPF